MKTLKEVKCGQTVKVQNLQALVPLKMKNYGYGYY